MPTKTMKKNTRQINFHLEPSLIQRVKLKAALDNCSYSDVIARLIKENIQVDVKDSKKKEEN